eukprot:9071408-Karenia_brevis.AAC.1
MLPTDPPCEWKNVSRITTFDTTTGKLLQDIDNVRGYDTFHFRRTIDPATEKVFNIETPVIYYDKLDLTSKSSTGTTTDIGGELKVFVCSPQIENCYQGWHNVNGQPIHVAYNCLNYGIPGKVSKVVPGAIPTQFPNRSTYVKKLSGPWCIAEKG